MKSNHQGHTWCHCYTTVTITPMKMEPTAMSKRMKKAIWSIETDTTTFAIGTALALTTIAMKTPECEMQHETFSYRENVNENGNRLGQ